MRDIYFLFLGLVILGVQTLISNLFFSGKLVVEISLIIIIYAGFHLNPIKGGIFSFIIGFFLDCLMGSISGFFALIYMIIFLISIFASSRVYVEKMSFIMAFVSLCALIEGIMVMSFYRLVFELDMFHHLWDVFLPQAIIVGLLAPSFFSLFRSLGVFSRAATTRTI